ncbi:hypothetical protein [Arabiibacter massiliensis]|uniref:hypothetical protein n=1 Tax=Arabiibacter massiliensis TaxID=1870985 RepID=UPI0009BAADE9|nr:hypothetical protein [Arabiibacter massiliensis]
MDYDIVMSEQVKRKLAGISSRPIIERLKRAAELLETLPESGRTYDPSYDAAQPPFACRHLAVPGTRFTYYYAVDHQERTVFVLELADQRTDPTRRFRGWE